MYLKYACTRVELSRRSTSALPYIHIIFFLMENTYIFLAHVISDD